MSIHSANFFFTLFTLQSENYSVTIIQNALNCIQKQILLVLSTNKFTFPKGENARP